MSIVRIPSKGKSHPFLYRSFSRYPFRKYEKQLRDIEKQIEERMEVARKLVGTMDDAICQICQKTKFADGIGHKCYYCQLRSCARCGGRLQIKVKQTRRGTLSAYKHHKNTNAPHFAHTSQFTSYLDSVLDKDVCYFRYLPKEFTEFKTGQYKALNNYKNNCTGKQDQRVSE
ncbi:hypothetical protein D918_06200 [Trichuris suis]|nr:hypothetical protein D918_06200 [Trichuris suis]